MTIQSERLIINLKFTTYENDCMLVYLILMIGGFEHLLTEGEKHCLIKMTLIMQKNVI